MASRAAQVRLSGDSLDDFNAIASFFKGVGLPASEADILKFALTAGAVKAEQLANTVEARDYADEIKARYNALSDEINQSS